MRRFFVPLDQSRDEVFELPEREARHATQVLRLGPGDDLSVLDGSGGCLTCVVKSATKRNLLVVVRNRQYCPPLPCPITLIPAIPKGPAFEAIVQKATELGAARIIPLLSERVVTHINPGDADAKVEKWRQIAIESIKQCGSPWLPEIESPIRFSHLIQRLKSPPDSPDNQRETALSEAPFAIVCSLEERARTLREALANFAATRQRRPTSTLVWIGPEGDFTPDEYEAIVQLGAAPVTLGPLVLRADTATITILAMLNAELQT